MKLRLIFQTAMPLTMWAALLTHPALADPIISVQPSSKIVAGASAFSLEIAIANVVDLFAFQFDLGFDPLVLSATGTAEGAFLPGGGTTVPIPGTIDNIGGAITGTADALTGFSGVSGSGVLATVAFQSIGDGTSPISLFNVLLLDSNLNGIAATIQDGTVEVSGISTVVPEPSTLVLLAAALFGLRGLARKNAAT